MPRNNVRLDPEQQAIVALDAPAVVVRAPAGTGKTEVVAQRVERLLALSNDTTSRVACLSYTNKAANELRDRFRERLGDQSHRAVTATIHAFAHDLIRQHGTWIGLPLEPEIVTAPGDRVQMLLDHFAAEGRELDESEGRELLERVDRLRARPTDAPTSEHDRELLTAWDAVLTEAGVLDFGALLPKAIEILELRAIHRQIVERYRHVIVDEAQNLTPIQYELLTSIVGPVPIETPTLTMVGDPDQGIVEFAGADPNLMLQFGREYEAETISLVRNYRSARVIVELGQAVKSELGEPPSTRALTYPAPGDVTIAEFKDADEEAVFVASWIGRLLTDGMPEGVLAPNEETSVRAEDIAVIGRSAASLRPVSEALAEKRTPTAFAIRPEDWLATDIGEVVVAATALAAGSSIGPQRILREVLSLESTVRDVEALGNVLNQRQDALNGLAPVVGAMTRTTPADFVQALGDLAFDGQDGEVRADMSKARDGGTVEEDGVDPPQGLPSAWSGDLQEIQLAWEAFSASTRPADRTWPSWSVFLSRYRQGNDLTDGVPLLTVHKSQGREYRAVAVVALNDGQFPDFRATTASTAQAELRTFYVAVSRPTRLLLLTRYEVRETRYGARGTVPSPFLRIARPHATNHLG